MGRKGNSKGIVLLIVVLLGYYGKVTAETGDTETGTVSPVREAIPVREGVGSLWFSSGGWFFTLNAGGQVYFGDHDKQAGVFKRLAPGMELMAGKWLTDYLGLRLGVNGFALKGLTQNGTLSNGKAYDRSQWLYHQRFNYIGANMDVLFDWLQLDSDNFRTYSSGGAHPYSLIP